MTTKGNEKGSKNIGGRPRDRSYIPAANCSLTRGSPDYQIVNTK